MSNNTLIAIIVLGAFAAIVFDRFLSRPRKQQPISVTRPYTVSHADPETEKSPVISPPPEHGWPEATEK